MTSTTGEPAHLHEGWRVGRLMGVPVIVARSWFLMAAVITVFYGSQAPVHSKLLAYGAGLIMALVFMLSVLIHEVAHAAASKSLGLGAERIVLTMWGGHTQFSSDLATPSRTFVVAVAGPVSNLILGCVLFVVALSTEGFPAGMIRLVAWINIILAVFNLAPGIPLDGGRMLESVIWKVTGNRLRGTIVAAWCGRIIAVLFAVVVILRVYDLYRQTGRFDFVQAAFTIAVSYSVFMAASEALERAKIESNLGVLTIDKVVRPAVELPSTASADEAFSHGGTLVVLRNPDGSLAGLFDPDVAMAVPGGLPERASALSCATALPAQTVPATLQGRALLEHLATLPGEEWAVVDTKGTVVGVVYSDDVVEALDAD